MLAILLWPFSFIAPKTLNLYDFPISRLLAYQLKVIKEAH